MSFLRSLVVVSAVVLTMFMPLAGVNAQPVAVPDRLSPPNDSSEAVRMMKSFQLPSGMVVDLFAAEPGVQNPVAFCIDEQGRVYVAESFRQSKGVDDNRGRGFWLNDDLASKTVADRLKMYEKWAHKVPGGMDYYRKYDARITQLTDTDGDGKADQHRVFQEGFNDPLDGSLAGLIARDGELYATNIPNLWLMQDKDNDGKADQRKSLSYGYGVRVALRGHDMHGLVFGPDGKLYFSIGDRGYHIDPKDERNHNKQGKTLSDPGSGAVFRCNPDGTGMELFATGLRNPQELAFDKHGNLWTGDNNSDAGDKARLVYVVEGGETGWHMSYQTMGGDYSRGPWHMDKLWHTIEKGHHVAWALPPIAWVNSGPSGLTYNPGGVAISKRYDDHFFLCDFRGSANKSGVQSFAVENHGAGFKMIDHHMAIKGTLATDCDFGYDGKLYVSDWVAGWNGTQKGRVYAFHDEALIKEPRIANTRERFAKGFTGLTDRQLADLLSDEDMRVRQRAQFELVNRSRKVIAKGGMRGPALTLLQQTALTHGNPLAQLHAVWGLGMVGPAARNVPSPNTGKTFSDKPKPITADEQTQPTRRGAAAVLIKLLSDKDPELRGQAAKLLGEAGVHAAGGGIVRLLKDDNPRVRFFAAMALGKMRARWAIPGILRVLKENSDKDVFLRHACVMGLTWMNAPDLVFAHADDEHRSVRLAVLLVMRRNKDARIAHFLNDTDPALVAEAARAINDVPIRKAMPALAEVLNRYVKRGVKPKQQGSDSLLRRAINANLRLGQSKHARTVARFAANTDNREKMRTEALKSLADWDDPSDRDRVLGYWRPLPARDKAIVRTALRAHLPTILQNSTGKVRAEATRLASRMKIASDPATFVSWVGDRSLSDETRIEALRLLATAGGARLLGAIEIGRSSQSPTLRAEALRLYGQAIPGKALLAIAETLKDPKATTHEKQVAYQTLGSLNVPQASGTLAEHLQALSQGKVAPPLQLDLLLAVEARAKQDAGLASRLKAYRDSLSGDLLTVNSVALEGGDAKRGRRVFLDKVEVQCLRCHKVEGQGAGEAGPDLTAIGKRYDRKYVLQAIVDPNATIAQGYEAVTFTLKDGTILAGTLKSETATAVNVLTTEAGGNDDYGDYGDEPEEPAGPTLVTVQKSTISKRVRGLSAMPQDIAKSLSRTELRDLVEFLFTNAAAGEGHGKGEE